MIGNQPTAGRCTHGGDCQIHPDVQGVHDYTVAEMRAELEQWRATYGENALRSAQQVIAERDRFKAIAEAARYEYGEMWCLDGECGHDRDADDDAPCPHIQERFATADQVLAVQVLTMSSGGDVLDDTDMVTVGAIRKALDKPEVSA